MHRQSAETDREEIALQKAREMEARFERAAKGEPEPAIPQEQQPTIAEIVALFLKSKADLNYTPKSLNRLRGWFEKRFVDYCSGAGLIFLPDVKLTHLEAWRNTWKLSPSTRAKIQGRIAGFFDWALRRDFVSKNPALGLERIKSDDRKPTLALTDEQFAAVLEAGKQVNGKTADAQRVKLRALCLLMRWSGLALGDALTLERTKLTREVDGWFKLFLRRQKTGVEVFCTIAPQIGNELLALENENTRYFFWDGKRREATIQDWIYLFRKLSAAAALKDEHGEPIPLHSHMLRNSFAIWCFNSDMSVEDVAALLGHTDTKVTQRHYSPWIVSRQARLAARVKEAYLRSEAKAE
jgi:integrase